MHAIEALDNIIRIKQHLQSATVCDIKDFEYLLEKFSNHVMKDQADLFFKRIHVAVQILETGTCCTYDTFCF